MSIKIHKHSDLYVSEPNPSWFGNGANDSKNPKWTNKNWLKSRFHFSFAEHRYRNKDQFGVLRVMNDDLVQPDRGFGAHPHRDMEIITYIVRGKLTHQDSMGSAETLGRGSVQFMTAGTGVQHSEYNGEKDSDLRFIQSWIVPRERGLRPNYGSYNHPTGAPIGKNGFVHMASDVKSKAASHFKVNQDVNMFVAEVDAGKTVSLDISADRMAYLLCVEGDAKIEGKQSASIEMYDSAELRGQNSLKFTAGKKGAHLLVFEMKQ